VASSDRIRMEIAFDGGQIVGVLVSAAVAEEFERALGSGSEAAFPLDSEDGRYTFVLRRVVWVKRFARESRVGFGV
jgi:hypothetical protein